MTATLALAFFFLPQSSAPPGSAEQAALERALEEAGGSPVDYARAIERHLKQHPDSPRRAEYERVLAQAALDLKDKPRLLLYGVRVIEAGSRSPQLLDHVTRALLDTEERGQNERALRYARLLVAVLESQRQEQLTATEYRPLRGRRLEETEYALARARTFEARALANLGRFGESLAAAVQGWQLFPTEENARERARCLELAGRFEEALDAFAEALALGADRTASPDPAKDRARLAGLARKAYGEEAAFGPALLGAFDRAARLQAARLERLKTFDPNYGARTPYDFTLTSTTGHRLNLSSLKGKVVVLDFWATWCGPCRAQHPLYEQVKQQFRGRGDVVFLPVSTDENRAAVVPFLEAQKWDPLSYFEDGLASLLRVSSIPAAMVLDRQGNITSRMNGFIPERFAAMLSERIREALEEPPQ